MGQPWPLALLDRGREGGQNFGKASRGESGIKSSLVHWTVKQRWLKSWLMTDGSATVDMSPRSWSF